MTAFRLAIALGVWLLAWSSGATAAPRIGYLVFSALSEQPSPERQALIDGLKALGYDVGRNLSIEYRGAAFNQDVLDEYAEELVKLRVDAIVAVGTRPAQAALKATTSIPIVVPALVDPSGGMVASLARPGGNLTGITMMAPELGAKRLQLLREVAPKASRVAGLWNTTNRSVALEWQAMEAAAPRLGVTPITVPVRAVQDVEAALKQVSRERAGALAVLADPVTSALRVLIVEFAARQRLPAVYGWREFVDSGGLMAYGPRMPDLFRRAAVYVDKILKGAKPGDLPVEQPTTFELVINLKTARALGLTIPQSLLLRADHVIQ